MANIVHFVHGGGFVMYPLLLLALGAIAVIVERLLAFRQYGNVPTRLTSEVLSLASKRRFDDALKLCDEASGPVAACMGIVLRHRGQPIREVERLVEETGQEYFLRLERFLPVLDTTTTISPLMGLLGTIVGMIGAFNAIALQSHHGNNDAVLAGVGEALYATATGLTIAIVCFAAYNYFASRLRYVTSQTEQAATRLLNTLADRHRSDRSPDAAAASADSSQTPQENMHAIQTPSRA